MFGSHQIPIGTILDYLHCRCISSAFSRFPSMTMALDQLRQFSRIQAVSILPIMAVCKYRKPQNCSRKISPSTSPAAYGYKGIDSSKVL